LDEGQYVARGKQAIHDLLAKEHAAVWPEIEAKISERPQGAIWPHLLSKAREALVREGEIAEARAKTRGGREVAVWHLADLTGRERAFADASGRKRLLYTRFQSWSAARRGFPQGLIGPAGEAVLHRSLTEAAPHGYRLVHPDGAQVRHLLGNPVQGGPLDHAAILQLVDPDGRPAGPVVVPIEVKNIRHWIYPTSAELFQLLHKAALLQIANRDQSILPVLVCRRRNYYTWQMGLELGFLPLEVHYQFLLPRSVIDVKHLNEVRNELGYRDLKLSEDAEPRLVQAFTNSVPRDAASYAERWKQCGPELVDYFESLRDYMDRSQRAALMADFRDEASHLPGCDVE
jgi:hypothetical protein